MTLSYDIMVALHRGELTPAAAFAAQEARDSGQDGPAGRSPSSRLQDPAVRSTTRRPQDLQNYAAARADIEENGPETLRELLRATEALIERWGAAWSECERNSRRREVLRQWEASKAANAVTGGAAASPVPTWDLVVPLGMGSRHDDWELRTLLRSAVANLCGLRTVHVIGPRRPTWLIDHPGLRWHDWQQRELKNHDIIEKFVHAARHPDVSATFVAACDDWVFLRPVTPVTDWSAVQRGGVLTTRDDDYWSKAQTGTRKLLEAAGKPVMFYDCHTPSVMSRAGWETVEATVDWRRLDSHAVWSLYHNIADEGGPRIGRDGMAAVGWHSAAKDAAGPADRLAIDQAAAGRLFLAYNEAGLTPALRAWLDERFPLPAPWEVLQTAGMAGMQTDGRGAPDRGARFPGSPLAGAVEGADYEAAAMRLRAGEDPMMWALVHATDDALETCSGERRQSLLRAVAEADATTHPRPPVLGPDILGRLRAAGLDVWRPDLRGYRDRMDAAQTAPGPRLQVGNGEVTLGKLCGWHLGDTLCATPLATALALTGRKVFVGRNPNASVVFAGHDVGRRNRGRIGLSAPAEVGPGQHIQRVLRWFSLPEPYYPRPDIRLSPDEVAWAVNQCGGLARPRVILCAEALSYTDGYAEMAWQAWADALSESACVIQPRQTGPTLGGCMSLSRLTTRQFLALFSQADAYLGTWAAGIHCAAAFGLEAIVVTLPPVDPRQMVFPLPLAHIRSFLYPQHAYGIWRPPKT